MATTEVRAMAERPRQTHPGALADMVQRRLREYDTDPLRTHADAAADSGIAVRTLYRYARGGGTPDHHNARLLITWLNIEEQTLREAIERQRRGG